MRQLPTRPYRGEALSVLGLGMRLGQGYATQQGPVDNKMLVSN